MDVLTRERPITAAGQLDRTRVKAQQGLVSLFNGVVRSASAYLGEGPQTMGVLAPAARILAAPTLNRMADDADAYVNRPVEGETQFRDVNSLSALGKFIADNGPGAAVQMPLAMSPLGLGILGTSTAGNIGQQRALNNGREHAGIGDVAAAAPFAAASLALDRVGAGRALAPVQGALAKTAAGRIAGAAGAEGLTEAAQGGLEYTGGTAGTDAGFETSAALEQAAAGGVLGAAMGGAVRSGVELPGVLSRPATPLPPGFVLDEQPQLEAVPQPPIEQATPAQPVPIAEPQVPESIPTPAAPAPAPVVAPQPAPTPAAAEGKGLGGEGKATAPTPETVAPTEPVELRPEPGELAEGERLVRTPAGGSIRTRFEVVEASTLRQAEGDNQNRDRSRDTTDLQVQDIISKFDPELLNEDPSSDRGAPIVGEDGAIDSGNGRVLTLNRIYEAHPEQATKYRAMIEGRGFSTEGMDRPVLVQRRTTEFTPEQRRQFVIDSNKDTKLELSPVERARSDADSISPEMLATYAGGDLNSTANAGFVQSFNKRLTAAELGNMIGSDRRLTTTGAQRIENAIVAQAYGEPKLLERMMESGQDDIRSITGTLADVAAPWAKLRASAKGGEIEQGYDITADLTDAAARVSDARKRGIKPADLLSQDDAFDQISPVAAELIRGFHNTAMTRATSRKAMTELLNDYIKQANAQESSDGLFGAEPAKPPAAILKDLLAARDNPNGAGLEFDAAESPDAPKRQARRNEGGDADRAGKATRPQERDEDAGDTAENVDEARDGYAPSHVEASFTNRQSVYQDAARAVGLTWDKFNLLPPARKVKLLSDALHKLTGIRASVSEKMPLQKAIDQLLDAHQTLQGMAKVLGITPKALSLEGKLTLQLIKTARFLGAFYSGQNLIKLPGRSNSFAHEWAHALDYYLLARLTPSDARGLTGEIRNSGADFTPANVREAFVNLLNTMYFDKAGLAAKIMKLESEIAATKSEKQRALLQAQRDRIADGNSKAKERSAYYKGAKQHDNPDYWTRPTEMFARAFEAWIAFKTEAEGLGNEFITKGDALYAAEPADGFAATYPLGTERMAIFDALQKMMDALNTEALLAEAGDGEVTARVASGFDDVATPGMKALATKSERKTRSLARTLFGADITAWEIGRANAGVDAEDSSKRRPEQVKLLSRVNNARSIAFSAASDGVKMVAERWSSKAAQRVHDHFSHDLGGVRHVDRVWDEAITIRENRALNPVFAELEKQGSTGWIYKKLDSEQRDTLRRLLQGETVADDMGMTRLASLMRNTYNDEWYANTNAGIDLGYVKDTAYLNRQTDRELVAAQPDKFSEQAELVYELVFDRDVGSDPDEIASDDDRLENFLAIAKRHKIEGLKELRQAIRDQQGASTDPEAEPDPEAIAAAIEAMYDDVRSAYAVTAAAAYRDAILHESTFPDFTATSTLPDSEKRRSLPAEADELLKDFYNPDPVSAFVQYVTNSVRRSEWARRFGPAGEKGKKLDEQMAREGVPTSDRQYVWMLAERMAGRYRRTGLLANPAVAGALSALRVKGTLAMMGRAVTLSFFEPASLGIVAANPKFGVFAVAKTWANVLHSGTRREKMEWARAQGFIKHHMLEQIQGMDRFGTAGDTPTKLDRLPSAMFRNSGLTFLTDASDAAVLDVGRRSILNEMAHRVSGGGKLGKEAESLMRELGVRHPEEFSQQIVDLQGAMPSNEWLGGAEGWDYNTALIRLSKMTIQKPSAANLAPLGRNPLASYATYSITAFLQSAYRHLLKRNIKIGLRLARAHEFESLARFSAGALAGVSLLYSLNLLSSVARELLFNQDRQDEWERDGKWLQNNMALAASRTFSFGALDPVVNSATGLKYNRDLSYLPLGAYAGADAQNLTKVAKVFTTNSRKTNTAEHNALAGMYNFAVSPLLAAGAASLPGGPGISATGGFFTAAATSPQASKEFGNLIVGTKDTRKTKTPTAYDKALEAAFGPKESKKDE